MKEVRTKYQQQIQEKYSILNTEVLVNLSKNLYSLAPEAIYLLRKELLTRGEALAAGKIDMYLISNNIRVSEISVKQYILALRSKKTPESDVDKEITSSLEIDQDYVNYVKAKIKDEAKECFLNGLGLAIVPIVFTLFTLIFGYLTSYFALVLVPFGALKLLKSLKLSKTYPKHA
jgi:hypothetical protein